MIIRVKSLFTYSIEIALASLMALVLFTAVFWLMNRYFPIGPGLDVLMSGNEGQINSPLDMTRSLWVASGDSAAGLDAGAGDQVAMLSNIRNDVRSKKADTIAWQAARQGMQLFDRDSVQTFSRSTASIKFDADNEIELGPNSLIVIKRLERDLIWPERKTFMVMVDGELRGKVKPTGDKPVFVQIETPNAVASVQSADNASAVDFQIKVNADASSSITVFEGAATITGAGKSVKVNANQTSIVDGDSAPSLPEPLPDQVRLISPNDNKQYVYRELPPKVEFTWAADDYAASYRFLLARDAEFKDVFFETKLKGTKFEHGNLTAGHYFWRVIGLNKKGVEGAVSTPLRVQLKQDLAPPQLDMAFPAVATGQKRYTLRGKAEPGATVFVGGKEVAVDAAGVFSYDIDLKSGVNLIVIEVVDSVGNVTYKSETVHGKF